MSSKLVESSHHFLITFFFIRIREKVLRWETDRLENGRICKVWRTFSCDLPESTCFYCCYGCFPLSFSLSLSQMNTRCVDSDKYGKLLFLHIFHNCNKLSLDVACYAQGWSFVILCVFHCSKIFSIEVEVLLHLNTALVNCNSFWESASCS